MAAIGNKHHRSSSRVQCPAWHRYSGAEPSLAAEIKCRRADQWERGPAADQWRGGVGWRRHGRSSLSSGLRRSRTQAHLPCPPTHTLFSVSCPAWPRPAQPSLVSVVESCGSLCKMMCPHPQVSRSRCRLYLEMADDVRSSIWSALSRDTAAAPRLPANFSGKYLQSQSIRAVSCCMWVESWTTLPSPAHHWHGREGVVLSVDRCSAKNRLSMRMRIRYLQGPCNVTMHGLALCNSCQSYLRNSPERYFWF